jgi:hypothetical protein
MSDMALLPWLPWATCNMKILLISNLNYKVEPNRIPLYALMCLHFKDSFTLAIFAMKMHVTRTASGMLEKNDIMVMLKSNLI